ncbi:MAG: hypothetical protein LBF28_02270 [Rickettsiales bacterium]|jgi:hypothetical protein|nr:hypothetical protein [Rickettsiales bacterium]
MKKKLYLLSFFVLMAAATASANSEDKKKAAEKAKQAYLALTAGCRSCEQEVEADRTNGGTYSSLKKQTLSLSDSLKIIDSKYSQALAILQKEIDRSQYNTKKERKEYKRRREELEKMRQQEIDAIYDSQAEAYKNLAAQQKKFWGDIVDRRVQESMKK